MKIEQAKIICKSYVDYVIYNIHHNTTNEQIGLAIDCIVDNLDTTKYFVEKLYLIKINLWRRGEIEIHPFKSTSRAMELVIDCVNKV